MPSCPFCQSIETQFGFKTKDQYDSAFDLLICKDCSTHFLDPPPNKSQLAQAYSENYYGQGEEKFSEDTETILNFFRKKRAKRLRKQIGDHGRVLDIGCGNGKFLYYLNELGSYEMHGIEPEGKGAERSKNYKFIQLKTSPLEKLSFTESSFDAITLFHVYEHLPNPKEILDICTKLLKPNGILYISFPNIESWQAKRFKGNWLHLDPPRHLHFPTIGSLTHFLRTNKLNLIFRNDFHPEYNPFGFQQSYLNKIFSKRELCYEALKGNWTYAADYPKWKIQLSILLVKATYPIFFAADAIANLFSAGATVNLIFRKSENE